MRAFLRYFLGRGTWVRQAPGAEDLGEAQEHVLHESGWTACPLFSLHARQRERSKNYTAAYQVVKVCGQGWHRGASRRYNPVGRKPLRITKAVLQRPSRVGFRDRSVGFGDAWSTIAEAAIVLSTSAVLAAPRLLHRRDDHGREVVNAGLAIAVVFVTALALYSAVAGPPFVSHVG